MLLRPRLSFLLATVLLAGLPAASWSEEANDAGDADWVLVAKARTPDDISLWTRTIPGAELKAFRGATEFALPMDSLLAFLDDTPRTASWMFRCREARALERREDGVVFVHFRIDSIWPLDDRDAIVKVVPEYDPATGAVRLVGTAAPDYLPPEPGYIRVPSVESTWLMRPTPDGRTYVEWTGHVDLGGKVPRWLANTLAPLVPRYTLKKVRAESSQPLWRQPAQREHGTELLKRFRQLKN